MNLQSIQKGTAVTDILPKTMEDHTPAVQPPIIIQNADGSQTHIIQAPPECEEGEKATVTLEDGSSLLFKFVDNFP